MPSYYNPYNFFPASYNGVYPMQNSQQGVPQIDSDLMMKWVEGEVGAKAFQMPAGWPVNKPIPLWDTTDTVVWIKSWNQIGAPNPMQKLKYEIENQPQIALPAAVSNQEKPQMPDLSNYVTKDEIAKLREEFQTLIPRQTSQNRQNGSQGGSR